MASQGSYDTQQVLKTAISMEGEASKNYLDAAKVVSSADVGKDQVTKNMFKTLAMWEGEHLFILDYWLGLQNK